MSLSTHGYLYSQKVKKKGNKSGVHLPTLNQTTEVAIPLDVQKSNALKKKALKV